MITLEALRAQYPGWTIDDPHFMKAREGSAAGEVGYDKHWRTFFQPADCQTSKWVKMAFGETAQDVINDVASRLPALDKSYKEEM